MTELRNQPNQAALEELRRLAKKGGSKSCEDHTFERIGPQAIAVMQLLIHRAKNHKGKLIGYEDLGIEVYKQGLYNKPISKYRVREPLGIVGYALLELSTEKRKVPPLTTIVVRKVDKFPGGGVDTFIDTYFSSNQISYIKMSSKEKLDWAALAQNKVFEYQHWDKILNKCGLSEFEAPLFPRPLPSSGKSNSRKRKVESPKPLRSGYARGGGGPSPEHEAIAKYVADHPAAIGLSEDFGTGETTYRFLSGDRPDVFFESEGRVMAVEVKPDFASEDDLERGIYQCIKYRAVARAQQKAAGDSSTATAQVLLVVGKALPPKLQKLAKQLEVDWAEISTEKCMSYKKRKKSNKG